MGVSLKPSDAVEGGAVPVDMNLTWKEARFNIFDYLRKDGTSAAQTVALRVKYVNDDGTEYEQQYSVGSPDRFTISEDGKILGPDDAKMARSCNCQVLLNAVVNAGFPENKLGSDASVLDGLYAFHIGLPEPKRSGLAPRVLAEGQVAREKVLSVPSQVLRLPWEKKTGKVGAKPATKEEDGGDDAIVAKAVEFVKNHATDGKAIRKSLGVAVFKELAKDPDKDAVAGLMFKGTPEFLAALAAEGVTLADK